jgi:dihydropteroate synthase
MGILNVTPDSFSDGGQFSEVGRAVDHAIKMEEEGADIIDIGGESTRPGAHLVSAEEEMKRVLPVITALAKKVTIPLSIDTTKAEVARRAVDLGASIVNDVSGLTRDPDMVSVLVQSMAGVVIMHSKGTPQTMQKSPRYKDVIQEIYLFLEGQIQYARNHGISKARIAIDPGIGFGKTVRHNLTLLNWLSDFKPLQAPLLVGPSRKSFIRKITGPEGIHEGTAATVAMAVAHGASILRVHDVAAMAYVSRITSAIIKENARL